MRFNSGADSPNKRISGARGEELAVQFLKKKGYRIIERNLRTPFGEIDIIAKDGRTLVFIEVKTRLTDVCGAPTEAITSWKKKRLQKCALYYSSAKSPDSAVRFDVVSIHAGHIDHIKDAFETEF